MTSDQYLGLAAYLAGARLSVSAYCRRRNIPPTTLLADARRVGVRLGLEIRRRRVAMVERARREHPTWTQAQCVEAGGFDTWQHFNRARRSVERMDQAAA